MVSVGEQPTEMPAAMGSVVLSHIRSFRGRCAESVHVRTFEKLKRRVFLSNFARVAFPFLGRSHILDEKQKER